MIRAGAVVAQRLTAVNPHKNRAGGIDQGEQRFGIGNGQLQVLGGDGVAHRRGVGEVPGQDQCPAARERLADDSGAGHVGQQAFDVAGHRVQVTGIRADQQRLRRFVVFGLREQVHRDPFRRRAGVGDHQHLGRTGDHVDAHAAEHLALGLGYVAIAGTDDLVHPGQARCAQRQRRHGLRAADTKHPLDAGQRGRRQHQRIALPARGRRHGKPFGNAGHLGGDGVHQHGGGIAGLAAGHVHPDPGQRGDALAEAVAVRVLERPVRRQLAAVERLDTGRRLAQRVALIGRQAR